MSDSMAQWRLTYRIVLDASVLYSACLSSTGASRELYRLATEGYVILILCDYTIEEVRSDLQENENLQALTWLDIALSNLQYEHATNPSGEDVRNNLSLVPDDPKDVPYLLLAKNTKADFIVSFDNHLLKLGRFSSESYDVQILRAGECLHIIRETL